MKKVSKKSRGIDRNYAIKHPERFKLDAGEEAIQKDLENENFVSLHKSEAKKYQEWAKAQVKSESIHIRLSEATLVGLKALAAKRGSKYHTLIGDILKREALKAG